MRRMCYNCKFFEPLEDQSEGSNKGLCLESSPGPDGFWPTVDALKHFCWKFKPPRWLGIVPIDKFKKEHGYP